MTSTQTASSIEVAVRLRPLRGDLHESKPAWRVDATSLTESAQPDNAFTFDRVYDTTATTAEVYKRNVRHSIVARVAQGYNGTVFAYGQTGSGKSYTMFGDAAARSPGLVRLAVHDLFKALAAEQQQKSYMQTEVFVSVLEIYNEQLRDLLRPSDGGRDAGSTAAPPPPPARGSSGSAAMSSATATPPPPSAPVLSIRENEYGVYVHNALRTQVATEQACTSVIYTHAASRVSAATAMNEHSSRSHCVIRILVERSYYLEDAAEDGEGNEEEEDEDEEEGDLATLEDDDDGRASSAQVSNGTRRAGAAGGGMASGSAAAAATTGSGKDTSKAKKAVKHRKKVISTLNMVDLAGSERVAKTGATGLRMVEGGHINKSLTTLTTVINRLASEASHPAGGGAAASFIPYRDSRLTHLLKTALGGNSFTAVLCCITPAVESANESRSTLQFASRAKRIKNKVRVNEVADAQTRLRELEAALRHTKKLLVAQTLYLWSTQLKIRKYEAQLSDPGRAVSQHQNPTPTAAPNASGTTSAAKATGAATTTTPPGYPAPHMNQQQQQSMIIAQLTAQNEALQEKVRTLTSQLDKAHEAKRGGRDEAEQDSTAAGTSASAAAAVAEAAALRGKLESAKRLLKERETALAATQASLDELDGLCRELESENKSQAESIKTLTGRTREADELMAAVADEHAAGQHEVALLRAQLQQSQARLLEKHRGDDYLAELTKLHVEHQGLQYSYSQLKEKADREKTELVQRLNRLTEANNALEDGLDEAKDHSHLVNSYLWRLLSAAAQVTQGTPLQVKDPSATVRDAQVAEAVRSLTSFAVMAHTTGLSGGSAAEAQWGGGGGGGESVRQLRSRVEELEEQLVAKDAQRDVIIDTKLKRIQGLVLRIHSVNIALVAEMRRCFHDNELLFEIAMKSSKTQKKVEKAGLAVRSLESALDRARFTQPPHKPLYHN